MRKDDLIAELKRSKDMDGVRKLREERAKSAVQILKEESKEIGKDFTAESFLNEVGHHQRLPVPTADRWLFDGLIMGVVLADWANLAFLPNVDLRESIFIYLIHCNVWTDPKRLRY